MVALLCLVVSLCGCSDATPGDAPRTGSSKVEMPAVDWRPHFAKATIVTPKEDYVHFLWDVYALRDSFVGDGARARLAAATLALVLQDWPEGVAGDRAKVDIVVIEERDSYGNPRWDALKKIAHLELDRARVRDAARIEDGVVRSIDLAAFDVIEMVEGG